MRVIVALLALLGFGCATVDPRVGPEGRPVSTVSTVQASPGDAARWYYLRFQFHRNADDAFDRHLDLLVANEIVAPVLAEHRDDIVLWRFHRRWPDDSTGHRFSFIVLTTPAQLALIDRAIQERPALGQLRGDGHLRRYRVDEAKGEAPGAVAATSDPAWPPLLQREWPHFIMGASQMWLGLVATEAERADGSDLYARYTAAGEALDQLWFEEGNHALFHHLSALFGYQPLRVMRRDIMTF